MAEYKLSYTAKEIDDKLGKVDNLEARITNLSSEIADKMQLTPEFVQSLEELEALPEEARSKLYVLTDKTSPDYGYVFAWMKTVTEGITKPKFTNLLDTATISLNKRYNSSDQLKDADGYIAIDHIPVNSKDTIRINNTNVMTTSASYNRVKYYNASNGSISTYNGTDARGDQLLKITTEDGVISWDVGYYNSTAGDNSTNTLPSAASNIAFMRMNLYISSSKITEADIAGLVVTKNEKIEYETTGGGISYAWTNTGLAFIRADYGDKVVDLEKEVKELKEETESLSNQIANKSDSALGISEVFAPSPQLPADGTETSDFNAETISCTDIYAYIDALVAKYPKYISKEVMGKDESGLYDWNRYTLCRRYYDAWQKVNYPKMYAWTNGSTTIYSVSVSPRIGDTMYTTKYVDTSNVTVTTVNNKNRSRTVGGVEYVRDETKDVKPTLVYTETYYNPYHANEHNYVYDSSLNHNKITIKEYSGSSMKDSSGNSYVRYPFGDRNELFEEIPVIVIGANEHGRIIMSDGRTDGDPATPAVISVRMIKDLCECVNANNPFLNLLKNNYKLVFCPVINPYGLSSVATGFNGYYNKNGINIDRNFDTAGWHNNPNDSGTMPYGGSENETQYFMNTIVESGAKIVTANHGLGTKKDTTGKTVNAGLCHWMLGRNNNKYNDSFKSIGAVMSANYNLTFTDYGEAPPESNAKTRSYIDSVGAEGGAVEMQSIEGLPDAEGNIITHTAHIMEANYTLLLQLLYMLIAKQDV